MTRVGSPSPHAVTQGVYLSRPFTLKDGPLTDDACLPEPVRCAMAGKRVAKAACSTASDVWMMRVT